MRISFYELPKVIQERYSVKEVDHVRSRLGPNGKPIYTVFVDKRKAVWMWNDYNAEWVTKEVTNELRSKVLRRRLPTA